MTRKVFSKKTKTIIGVAVIVLLLLGLNIRSRYIPSENGRCGIFITNNWLAEFKDPVTGNHAPQYCASLVIWYGEKPKSAEITAADGGGTQNIVNAERRGDSYTDIRLWNWLCALHLPRLSFYPFDIAPVNNHYTNVTAKWKTADGKSVSYDFDLT